MIIWGWSTKNIGSKKMDGTCPKCQSKNLHLVGNQRVFDLFWIPTIPLKKETHIVCGSCSSAYTPHTDWEKAVTAETKFRTPWWSFSGLMVIAAFAAFITYAEVMESKENQHFKENPYKNAYFAFRVDDPSEKDVPYTFAKVEHIDGNKIQLSFSKYAYSSESMAVKAAREANNKPDALEEEIFEVSKEDFKNLDIRKVVE